MQSSTNRSLGAMEFESASESQRRSPAGRPPRIAVLSTAVILALALATLNPGESRASNRKILLEVGSTIDPITWELAESGFTYKMIKGGSALHIPVRDADNAASGVFGLTFQIDPAMNGAKQRTEYELARNVDLFPRGSARYIGFSVKVPSDFPLPTDFVTIFQVYQRGGCSPPVTFNLENRGGQLKYVVKVRNTEYNRCGPNFPIELTVQNMPQGSWQRFVLEVTLDSEQNGTCRVWRNGTLIDERSGIDVGFPPGWRGPNGGDPAYDFGVAKFGLYRGAQQNSMTVSFDDIKFSPLIYKAW